MPIRIVQSKQNTRLKELRHALAHPARRAGELAGIEGPNLLKEALRAGLRVPTVFATEQSESLLHKLSLPRETDILITSPELLCYALATETPQPVAALVEPPVWNWMHFTSGPKTADLKTSPLLILLAGLQDPGNLGTILRSAEAFGATGILSLPGTVSPWNPKATRASAGSIFRMPFLAANAKDCFTYLGKAGITVLTTATRNAESITHVDLVAPTALLIGNEGNGVPAEIAKYAEKSITIPCPGPVESLNAAVATAILLYEASRQRGVRR